MMELLVGLVKVIVFGLAVLFLGFVVLPAFVFTLTGAVMAMGEEFYCLLVSYDIIRPKVRDTKLWEVRRECLDREVYGTCNECPYRTETGCGFTGPPGKWNRDLLEQKRILRWLK